jgi:hypothetical protein
MIITTSNGAHTVDILDDFFPKYIRALKFFESYSFKTKVSDRTALSDKYECSFTVIGDTADVNDLVFDLSIEKSQIIINTQGIAIFGTGIDHGTPFICNMIGRPVKYPVRDIRKTAFKVNVKVVSPVAYDSQYPTTLPRLFYQWPIARGFTRNRREFNSSLIGGEGVVTIVDSEGVPLKGESAGIKVLMTNDEFGQLHRFVANLRGDSFTLDTETFLELFLQSSSEDVKMKVFKYRPKGFNLWEVDMVLVNNI